MAGLTALVRPIHRERTEATFDSFYRDYYIRVLMLIRRHFPTCDPEEVAQETMTRCYTHFEQLDYSRDPWPWVASVARNSAIDGMRRGRRYLSAEVLPDLTDGGDSTYDAIVRRERSRSLATAMSRLRSTDRELLAQHDLEGITCAEIAALRDVTPNALRQQLHRARRRLATELRRVGGTFGLVFGGAYHTVRRTARTRTVTGTMGASACSVIAVAGLTSAVSIFGAGLVNPGHAGAVRTGLRTQGSALSSSASGETPDHRAVVRAAGAGHVAAAPPAGTVDPIAVTAQTNTPPLTKPGNPNSEGVKIRTPWGVYHLDHYGEKSPGYGVVCATPSPVVDCS